jgi:hypothetical protein
MSQQSELATAEAKLNALLERTEALAIARGDVPPSVQADLKALKVTMMMEEAAVEAAKVEKAQLARTLQSLAKDNATLEKQVSEAKAALGQKRGWTVDARCNAPVAGSAAAASGEGTAAAAAAEEEPQPKKSKSQLKKEAKAASKAAANAKNKAAGGGGKGGKKKKGGGGGGGAEPDGPSTPPGPYTGPAGVSQSNIDEKVKEMVVAAIQAAFPEVGGEPDGKSACHRAEPREGGGGGGGFLPVRMAGD